MSNMAPNPSEHGYINKLVVSLIGVTVLLVAAIAFGGWAFMSRQDYKDNSDQKVAVAVQEAIERTQAEEAARYAEESKEPLKPYTGPSQYGNVHVEYPKTWSAYIINRDSNNTPVEWYLHPDVVPDIGNDSNVYALRVELVSESYDREVASFDSSVEDGTVTVQPYSLPKVQDVVGSRINGAIVEDKQGSMILMSLRDRTLKIWTESNDYLDDFEKHILPNLTFVP
jgi:hypothetical protein